MAPRTDTLACPTECEDPLSAPEGDRTALPAPAAVASCTAPRLKERISSAAALLRKNPKRVDQDPRTTARPAEPRQSPYNRLRSLAAPQSAILGAAGWVTVTYGAQQGLRLLSNIVLAWLLSPALLGTMLLINTLRTGGELLTDVGVGQSIVNNARGNEPYFYNTAWTIQIVRGVLLFGLAMLLTVPLAHLYGNAELLVLLPVVAPIFIITGLTSPARFLLQKQLQVRKLALFDLASAIFGVLVQIALAWVMPTIWSLIWGLLVSTAVPAIASFFLIDWRTHRLRWDQEAVQSILHFGKWIFLSSLIYFLAMNFDRLYFADVISLTLLGVYGIAKTFADTFMQLFQRAGNMLIFPKISGSAQRGATLQQSIRPLRAAALVMVAMGLAFAVAFADVFIYSIYDERYHVAGMFLTILLFGTWFGSLATMADAIMMGVGKPSGVALSNGTKLAVIILTLPIVLPRFGMNAALAMFVAAEAIRYMVLMWRQRSVGVSFIRQDIAVTIIFLALVLFFRELSMVAGLTDGFSGWYEQIGRTHA